ncbi:hypothetical protein BHE74_00045048 [Ensete ventricosum]|nr:hypothetical protein BHE74_00045048 [Ensete ventricosum]
MEESGKKQQHFILVHGICQGAWCWYKLVTLLRSAGHSVTAVDLGATGVNPQRLDELHSMDDYVRPLFQAIASLPPQQKPVLVGHSFGGASVSLAMEKFPDKFSVAVFVTAVMPSTAVPMAALVDKFFKEHPLEAYLDSKVTIGTDPQNPWSRIEFGPEYMAKRLYQLSPAEVCVHTRCSTKTPDFEFSPPLSCVLLIFPGPDAGDAAGEARELVLGRSATRWDRHGGEVRVGEKGVRRVQGGLGHDRGLPALDDRSQPGGASGGDPRCRSYGDALQAGGSVQTPPRDCRKILLMTMAHTSGTPKAHCSLLVLLIAVTSSCLLCSSLLVLSLHPSGAASTKWT